MSVPRQGHRHRPRHAADRRRGHRRARPDGPAARHHRSATAASGTWTRSARSCAPSTPSASCWACRCRPRARSGRAARSAQAFAERLRAALAVPVELIDESFSTVEAEEVLLARRPVSRAPAQGSDRSARRCGYPPAMAGPRPGTKPADDPVTGAVPCSARSASSWPRRRWALFAIGWSRTPPGTTAIARPGGTRGPIEIEIPKGASAGEVADRLADGRPARAARRSSACTPASAAWPGGSRPGATTSTRRRRRGRSSTRWCSGAADELVTVTIPEGKNLIEIAEHPRRRRHLPQGTSWWRRRWTRPSPRRWACRAVARGLSVPRHLPAAAAHAGGARADPAGAAPPPGLRRAAGRARQGRRRAQRRRWASTTRRSSSWRRSSRRRPGSRRSGRASPRCSSTGSASRPSRPSCCRPTRRSSTGARSRCRGRRPAQQLGRPHPPHPARGPRQPVQHVHARGPAAGTHRQPRPRGAGGGDGAGPDARTSTSCRRTTARTTSRAPSPSTKPRSRATNEPRGPPLPHHNGQRTRRRVWEPFRGCPS